MEKLEQTLTFMEDETHVVGDLVASEVELSSEEIQFHHPSIRALFKGFVLASA